jgi:hypothetical protein
MAMSGAELRAIVQSNNQQAIEVQTLLYQVNDRLQQISTRYRGITDRATIEEAARAIQSANDRVTEAITNIIQAVDSANRYTSTV